MSGTVRPLALATILLLAGCSGFAGAGLDAGPGGSAATPTVTPAPVPEAPETPKKPTPAPGESVPGFGPDGIANASALAASHAAVLRGGAVAFVYNRTAVGPNGSVRSRYLVNGTVAATSARYHVVVRYRRVDGTDTRTVYRFDGDRVLRERHGPNGTERRTFAYGRAIGTAPRTPLEVLPVDPYFQGRLRAILSVVDVREIERRETRILGNRATFVLTGRSDRHEQLFARPGPLFRAVVDDRGVVRSYRFQYRAVRNGSRVTVIERLEYGSDVSAGENVTAE